MTTTDPTTIVEAQTTSTIANIPSSAAAKVFAIPELLEHILLCTDTRDVLRCKRLSRHTKAVIDESVALHRHVFTTPQPREWYVDVKVQEIPDSNEDYPIKPFFKPVESIRYTEASLSGNEESSEGHRRISMKHVNDIFFSVPDDRRPHEICCGGGGWEYCQACDLVHRHFEKAFIQADIILDLEAPLPELARGMHITQPPTNTVNICTTDLSGEGVIYEQTIENSAGLRIQDVVRGIEDLLQRNQIEKDGATGFWMEIADSAIYFDDTASILRSIGERGIVCTRFAEDAAAYTKLAVVPYQQDEDKESPKSHAARRKLTKLTKMGEVESRDDEGTNMTDSGEEQTGLVESSEETGSKANW